MSAALEHQITAEKTYQQRLKIHKTMTQKDFNESKEKFSNGLAEAVLISFKEYDWDKFVHVLDQSTQFGSTRKKYDLYKDNTKITPYLDETGNYKFYKGEDILMFQYQILNTEYFYSFLNDCQKDVSTRWNIWEFTLYPSGEYESEFIWDNEAHLDSLEKDAKMWFTGNFEQIGYRIKDKCFQLGIEWDFDVEVVISFTLGKANPVLFVAPNKPEINFRLYLDQLWEYIKGDYVTAFEEWGKIRVEDSYRADIVLEDEKIYHSMNYGELKNRFQRWNRATFIINKDIAVWDRLTFEDIKFEWLPENA